MVTNKTGERRLPLRRLCGRSFAVALSVGVHFLAGAARISRRSLAGTLGVCVLLGAAVGDAHGIYDSIFFHAIDFSTACAYDPDTGVIAIDAVQGADVVTLVDDGNPLTGLIDSTEFHLDSTAYGEITVQGRQMLVFRGGTLRLTFDYDDDAQGPNAPASYGLSGAIRWLVAEWTPIGPLGRLEFRAGKFWATTIELPGSNVWPQPDACLSVIEGLTLDFDHPSWDWHTDQLGDPVEFQGWLHPPEAGLSPLPPVGDGTGDCKVDLGDYRGLMLCAEDPARSTYDLLVCLDFWDWHVDGYVDTRDLAVVVDHFAGPAYHFDCDARRTDVNARMPLNSPRWPWLSQPVVNSDHPQLLDGAETEFAR